jgi:hypothetical protein
MSLFALPTRAALPRATDRLPLGHSGLRVSPICVGIVGDPATVPAAFDAGINFFFLTLDLHWPLYQATRDGLAQLFARGPSVRDEVVVGIVSYLDEPLFGALQVHEAISSVPGMGRADLLIAGGVATPHGFGPRVHSLLRARAVGHSGARAIGGSFHQRPYALMALQQAQLDVVFCRYNSAHPNGRFDLFPYVPSPRASLLYNFKSVLSYIPRETATALGVPPTAWLPDFVDCYRFALSRPQLDGLLCAPQRPGEVRELVDGLARGPLRPEEEDLMVRLSALLESRRAAAATRSVVA